MQVPAGFITTEREARARFIVRLADQSLASPEAAAAERRLPAELRRRLERHRAVVRALRADGPQTPAGLRDGLALREVERGPSAIRRKARRPHSLRRPALAGAYALMVVLVSSVLGLRPNMAPDRAAVLRVALVAAQLPTMPPRRETPLTPTPSRRTSVALPSPITATSSVPGPAGQRVDITAGRTVRTVDYVLHTGARFSYSVVAGQALPVPASMEYRIVAGVAMRVASLKHLEVVELVRRGRTCVLAGEVTWRTLAALAASPLTGSPSRSE